MHPIDDIFAEADDVSIEAVQYVSPSPGGRYVQLLRLRGDLERARTLLANSPDALEYDVSGANGSGVAYVQCRTVALVADLLSVLYDHEIVVDWPIRYLDGADRGLTLQVVGTSRAIQRAAADLPTGIDLRLERIGEYDPDARRLSKILTDRQLVVFEFAVAEGYYDVPRRTTHRELAARLDLSSGTVSEHLQRAESKIVDAYVNRT